MRVALGISGCNPFCEGAFQSAFSRRLGFLFLQLGDNCLPLNEKIKRGDVQKLKAVPNEVTWKELGGPCDDEGYW